MSTAAATMPHDAQHDANGKDNGLSTVFAISAVGACAGLMGAMSAPLTLTFGAVAALSGTAMAAKAVSQSGSTALVAAFTAAVTSFTLGIPFEFISEAVTFPFAHDTNFGNTVMQKSGEFLVPAYDWIGQNIFGIEPYEKVDLAMFDR